MPERNRALVVDDDEFIRSFVRMSLLKFEFSSVDTASSGNQAIEQLKKTHYSHVFLDKGLPDTDGLIILKAISHVAPACKVIMCTADGSLETLRDAMQLGISDYLVKPITANQVAKTMVRLGIDSRR